MRSAVSPKRPLLDVRIRSERGFGMIELLAAMSVMVIGLLAVFTMFQAGIVAVRRAGNQTTAAVLADSEMEKFRAIKYESVGLASAAVNAADSVYKGDIAYSDGSTATTTLANAASSSATSVQVASFASFPGTNGFRVKIDSEILRVTAGAGSATWTVKRGVDATLATAHSSGATVSVVQRVDVPSCGTAPCTTLVPTQNVTGADGRKYRIDTYATWTEVMNQGGAQGRALKLMTVVVRDQASPYQVWARVASTFDLSTG